MRLNPQFISVGVNRVVSALDWGEHGLIAYGGHWIVCIYDPEVWLVEAQAVVCASTLA